MKYIREYKEIDWDDIDYIEDDFDDLITAVDSYDVNKYIKVNDINKFIKLLRSKGYKGIPYLPTLGEDFYFIIWDDMKYSIYEIDDIKVRKFNIIEYNI